MERSSNELALVVFDFGGVLAPPPDRYESMARRLDVSLDRFMAAYWRFRDTYELGRPDEWYWTQVARELGVSLTSQACLELAEEDMRGWLRLAPESAELLADVRLPVALLSNAPARFAAAARASWWASAFEVMVFSADAGVGKPDRAIYENLMRPGLVGADVVFFDDTQANVEAARALGWLAFRWEGVAACRITLTSLLAGSENEGWRVRVD